MIVERSYSPSNAKYQENNMTLKSVKCNMSEQETTIQYSRDGKELHLYTSDNTIVTKMNRLLNAPGTKWRLEKTTYLDGEPTGYFFVCEDKRVVSLKAKVAENTRQYTEEEKDILRERMKNAQEARKKNKV